MGGPNNGVPNNRGPNNGGPNNGGPNNGEIYDGLVKHVSSRGRFVEIRGFEEIDIYAGFST